MEDLHADLQSHLQAGVLKHPLLVLDDFIDVPRANRRYRSKLERLARAERSGDWLKYICLHEQPYRLSAFRRIAPRLSDETYWRIVREIWLAAGETTYLHRHTWRKIWGTARPCRDQVMNLAEQKRLAGLDDVLTIYRSLTNPTSVNGLSWTSSREKALFVAYRDATDSGPPIIGTATVRKERILAYFYRSEVVVLPGQYENLVTRDLRR